MSYQIWNRRYTGSKYKLADWIAGLIAQQCTGTSFCDLFAGTGIVSRRMLETMQQIHINDFLYSNEVIYRAFFEQQSFDEKKLQQIRDEFALLDAQKISDNYVSQSFGGRFFSPNDARKIGFIREWIEQCTGLCEKERNILLASLLYSADKAANTVGHYDAYIKGAEIKDSFAFDLIEPYCCREKKIVITRRDANELAKEIRSDIVYIDPPYNSRQYSRFYHVLENLTTWKKPELYGVACKPKAENMSEYCKTAAPQAFQELIGALDCRFLVVSYNNTYASKSGSSRNKITLEQIQSVLQTRGSVSVYEKAHPYFNAGKTVLENHKELVFITKVEK